MHLYKTLLYTHTPFVTLIIHKMTVLNKRKIVWSHWLCPWHGCWCQTGLCILETDLVGFFHTIVSSVLYTDWKTMSIQTITLYNHGKQAFAINKPSNKISNNNWQHQAVLLSPGLINSSLFLLKVVRSEFELNSMNPRTQYALCQHFKLWW